MLVMFDRHTEKPLWCFRGNPFDVLGVSGVVRCNCHNLNSFNITSMTLTRRWVMRHLIWVWNDFRFHWHDAAEVDGRRLLYINVLSYKLTHNIHVSKRVRVDLGTSWLGYALTWVRVDQKGYELTRVRVDLGTNWPETDVTALARKMPIRTGPCSLSWLLCCCCENPWPLWLLSLTSLRKCHTCFCTTSFMWRLA